MGGEEGDRGGCRASHAHERRRRVAGSLGRSHDRMTPCVYRSCIIDSFMNDLKIIARSSRPTGGGGEGRGGGRWKEGRGREEGRGNGIEGKGEGSEGREGRRDEYEVALYPNRVRTGSWLPVVVSWSLPMSRDTGAWFPCFHACARGRMKAHASSHARTHETGYASERLHE